jgi:hypothetical protein
MLGLTMIDHHITDASRGRQGLGWAVTMMFSGVLLGWFCILACLLVSVKAITGEWPRIDDGGECAMGRRVPAYCPDELRLLNGYAQISSLLTLYVVMAAATWLLGFVVLQKSKAVTMGYMVCCVLSAVSLYIIVGDPFGVMRWIWD